jgi:hypothetical protein
VADGEPPAVEENEFRNAVAIKVDDERVERDEAGLKPRRAYLFAAGKYQPRLSPAVPGDDVA